MLSFPVQILYQILSLQIEGNQDKHKDWSSRIDKYHMSRKLELWPCRDYIHFFDQI